MALRGAYLTCSQRIDRRSTAALDSFSVNRRERGDAVRKRGTSGMPNWFQTGIPPGARRIKKTAAVSRGGFSIRVVMT
jgi:hypothetical protein